MCPTLFYLQQTIRKDLKGKKDFHFQPRSNRDWIYSLPWNNQKDRQTDKIYETMVFKPFQAMKDSYWERKTNKVSKPYNCPSFLPYEGFQAVAQGEKTQAELSQFSESCRGLEVCRRSPSSIQHDWPMSLRKLSQAGERRSEKIREDERCSLRAGNRVLSPPARLENFINHGALGRILKRVLPQ